MTIGYEGPDASGNIEARADAALIARNGFPNRLYAGVCASARRILHYTNVFNRDQRPAGDHFVENRQQTIDVRLVVDDLDQFDQPTSAYNLELDAETGCTTAGSPARSNTTVVFLDGQHSASFGVYRLYSAVSRVLL
jgi:hypothetical protein